MAAYIMRRVLWTIPVLFAIATITFFLMHSVEGGPWGDPDVPREVREKLEAEYGLDKPVWYQFGKYMAGLVRGDLGVSFESGNPVRDLLEDKVRISLSLGLMALAFSLAAGTVLGILSALWRGTIIDYISVALTILAASVPAFILGIFLQSILTGQFHWPSGGWGTLQQAVMPVLALSALPAAYIARITRASMLDVLGQDYIRTAHAKGLRTPVIVTRHMLRNALIPLLTVAGPIAAFLVTGSFVVEELFTIPGIGSEFVDSIGGRDYGVIMGITLFYTFAVVLANLAVDILYAFADPRIKYESYG
jgi:oligopeptide transport system permease protein